MDLFKKLMPVVVLASVAQLSAALTNSPHLHTSYLYHNSSLQYFSFIDNPNFEPVPGVLPYHTPSCRLPVGDPNMALGVMFMASSTNPNLFTLSFISGLGYPEAPHRHCLARQSDGTIAFADMTKPWVEDPACLWKIIMDSSDGDEMLIRLMVPGTEDAPLYMMFSDGLSVQPATELESAQFRICYHDEMSEPSYFSI